jgi:hypothetical protein
MHTDTPIRTTLISQVYRISGTVFLGRRSKSDSGVVFLMYVLCVCVCVCVGRGVVQIQGPRTPRRLNFVPWCAIFVGPQFTALFSHASDAWNFHVAPKFLGNLCIAALGTGSF